jgi:hypothetical protein
VRGGDHRCRRCVLFRRRHFDAGRQRRYRDQSRKMRETDIAEATGLLAPRSKRRRRRIEALPLMCRLIHGWAER